MPVITRRMRIAALIALLTACGEDRQRAEDGAQWLQDRYLFRPVGEIGEVTKIFVADAGLIRMEVLLKDEKRAELIDAQSLMIQSLIARYACPKRASKLWAILGGDVALRVDLKTGTEDISSAICKPE